MWRGKTIEMHQQIRIFRMGGNQMRRVILQEFVTLDGLAVGPNDRVDFVPASTRGDHSFGQEQLALMDAIETILLGRVTYQIFAGYWPLITEGEEKPFADKINATKPVCRTGTLDRARIRSRGPFLITQCPNTLNLGLDEYRSVPCIVVIGSGRPLFRDRVEPFEMKLSNAMALDRGAVLLTYSPSDSIDH